MLFVIEKRRYFKWNEAYGGFTFRKLFRSFGKLG